MRRAYMFFFSAVLSFLFTFFYMKDSYNLYGYDLDRLFYDAIVVAVKAGDPELASDVIDEAFKFFENSGGVYILDRYLYDSRRFADGYNSDSLK